MPCVEMSTCVTGQLSASCLLTTQKAGKPLAGSEVLNTVISKPTELEVSPDLLGESVLP